VGEVREAGLGEHERFRFQAQPELIVAALNGQSAISRARSKL